MSQDILDRLEGIAQEAFDPPTALKIIAVVRAALAVANKPFAGELFGHEMAALAELNAAIQSLEKP